MTSTTPLPTPTAKNLSLQNAMQPKAKSTTRPATETYSFIKASSEGGDKQMLDVIFECLKYSIKAEWTEGHTVTKILDTYEDVTISPPDRLMDVQKADDLYMAIWKERIKQHVIKLEALDRVKEKLYSTVWKLLSKVLKNKISGQTGFKEKNEASDVVWLVETVRMMVTDFNTMTPEFLSVTEALAKILNYQQTDKMENSEYVKNLLALIKVYEQYCGPYGLHHMEDKHIDRKIASEVDAFGVPLSEDAKQERRAEELKSSCEKAIAMQIIRGACKRRYSGLRKNLATDYGLKIDKYPSTIDDTVNMLNVAKGHLPMYIKKLHGNKDFNLFQAGGEQVVPGMNGKILEHIICHKCSNKGH
jgi:hypothetical protein